MYLGIDLGTSGIKVIVTDSNGQLRASVTQSLSVSSPKPLWSEQAPQDWVDALHRCMQDLATQLNLKEIKAIGLSGQMHGAVLLDDNHQVLRPAILWNDGRCAKECQQIEALVADSRAITGNMMMPGFTAPKLKWVQTHEPQIFSQINKVLLPKDYLRFILSGDFASDMSDSAGTLWLDVENRQWNESLLSACGLDITHMPSLFEGNQITGLLSADLAQQWQMNSVPLVAGGGDNAAGAIGVGLTKPGQGMLSLGTSGVYFLVNDAFSANPDSAVHSFCHALPNSWHLMSVFLSAGSCLQWFADSIVQQDVSDMMQQLNSADIKHAQAPLFLPYLSGERTPHNDPNASGVFFGLTHQTSKLDMLFAVLEGVCFAFADGVDAMHENLKKPDELALIGGGSKSLLWRQMFADVLQINICYREGGDVGPALGAARLAQLSIETDKSIEQICPQPPIVETYRPDSSKHSIYQTRRAKYQALYQSLKQHF